MSIYPPVPDGITRTRNRLRRLEERQHPYCKKMDAQGLSWRDLGSAEDLSKFPFTTKSDLLDDYPLGWLACDRDDLVRFHATSGTTGNPTVVAYTNTDIEAWSRYMGWCLEVAGLRKKDTIQVAYGYGLFTGGLGLHYGAEYIGAAVVPASGGFTERQLSLIKDLNVTAIACTPSYAMKLAEEWQKAKMGKSPLRIGIFGAEPWSEGVRKILEDGLVLSAIDVYGLSEAMGPGVAIECPYKNGLHINPDAFIVEIIDPLTGERVKEGEIGELVLTSLSKRAYPVIRYRTRDLTSLLYAPCPCGIAGPRIARIKGRSDDMIIIRGVNVFPSMVEMALLSVPGLSGNFVIDLWSHEDMQEIKIKVEMSASERSENTPRLCAMGMKRLQERLGVRVPLEVLPCGELPRFEGKASRVNKIK